MMTEFHQSREFLDQLFTEGTTPWSKR